MAHYKKMDNGKWLVKFNCKDHKGNNKQIKRQGFNTKKEAQDYVNDYLALHNGSENIGISTLITEFLKTKDNLKYNTKKQYNIIAKQVMKHFNNIVISDITKKSIYNFIDTYNDRPIRQKQVYEFLGQVFDYACTYFHLKDNVLLGIKFNFKKDKKIKDIWTYEDFKNFDNILKKHYDIKTRAYFNLLFYSGARPGEISGLTLQDLDYNNNTININKTRISSTFSNTPKNNASYRQITLPQNIIELLKSYTDNLPKIDNFNIFATRENYSIYLKRIIIEYNLPHITLHGFRHSHTSLLINKGLDIASVSNRLGHSNSNITLQIYTHLYKEKKRK
ncbi:tyrosine-type recombinase/integrase [Streptobacillus moniliformis]|uniref:tyrosine-type recombinase/integrase n=1 Tax=Streptobacillus moniliformis TaxID=34105 RepID=UPI0007E4A789|nr:tyrosine-type recombinase/integrase [Streptobacillus moniliformis]